MVENLIFGVLVFGLIIGVPVFMAYREVYCKLCRKRRSRWATVCPHCGRDV